jgi:hypothetical protein
MNKTPVTSSNIDSIGYDPDSQTLEIEFKNGSTYQYFDIPELIHTELINSDSIGGYLATNIKGVYRYSKV